MSAALPAELRGLLDAAKANPDDDAARLILADWLEDHGDSGRAEFVRLQVAISAGSIHDPAFAGWVARSGELRAANQRAWLDDVVPPYHFSLSPSFEKGLLVLRVDCQSVGRKSLQSASRSADWPWVEELTLVNVDEGGFEGLLDEESAQGIGSLCLDHRGGSVETIRGFARQQGFTRLGRLALTNTPLGPEAARSLADSPTLARLTSLTINQCSHDGPHFLGSLVRSPHLMNLKRLDLGNDRLTADALWALVGSWPVPGLESLVLTGNALGPDAARVLAAAEGLPRLTHLDLRGNEFWWSVAAPLADARILGSLTSLSLGDNKLIPSDARGLADSSRLRRLISLDLHGNGVGAEGALALVESPQMESLKSLHLGSNRLGPEGGIALAAAEGLGRLSVLHLGNNALESKGVQALAASPHLSSLRTLVLGGNAMTERGARALAASPHLDGLRSLDLRGEALRPRAAKILRERFGERVLL